MELIRIVPSESKLWEQVWRVYTESFPEYERRRISSHALACEDEAFNTLISLDNGNLMALLFYWKYEKTVYIEHIAVNPAMRGNRIGTTIMKQFLSQLESGTKVVLEIDPPQDEISTRRLKFYERLGFINSGFSYQHPSYTKNGTPHTLHILSWPENLTEQEFERFRQFMSERVMKYIE